MAITLSAAGSGPSGWPICGRAESYWDAPDLGLRPRSRAIRSGHFWQTVPVSIAHTRWLPDSNLLVLAEAAALEATKFDARINSWLWSYDVVLLRSEAAASSQIEQLSASPRAILQAELGDTSRANATHIAANAAVLRQALESSGAMTIESLLLIHQDLMAGSKHLTPGAFREVPVWIGGNNPIEARFVGAPSELVSPLMEDLVVFCKRTDVPAVVQAAIAHAQFETIHPFEDGNGRVGRALIHMILRSAGVMERAVLPVSGELLRRSGDYYSALDAYRIGQPEPIIRLFADSLLAAILNGSQLMEDIATVRQSWNARVKIRSDSRAWHLMDYSLRQPVFIADKAMEDLEINAVSFYRYAHVLTSAGILTRSKFYRDQDVWRAQEILDAMEGFAQRAGFRV